MKIEKILFPTAFKELAFNSLESLFVLKDAGLKEVTLCYVIPRDAVAFVPFGGYLKEEEERLREEARLRFEDWQNALSSAGIASTIIIEVGEPVPKILAIAAREKVDLIVAGKKKKTEVENIFIGSHTMAILRRSPVPVLVHKYMVQFEWDGEIVSRTNDRIFEKPLLTTDWSLPSESARDLLLSLKGVVKRAAVAHVIDAKLTKGLERNELLRIEQESEDRLKSYQELLEQAGITTEVHLSAGQTVMEIIRISREVKASMIIMGTTGKDRMHELFLGSVSHRVAEMSELPTFLVP
ncbi:MAG: universal stress protein [Nitrospirota bacterium]